MMSAFPNNNVFGRTPALDQPVGQLLPKTGRESVTSGQPLDFSLRGEKPAEARNRVSLF